MDLIIYRRINITAYHMFLRIKLRIGAARSGVSGVSGVFYKHTPSSRLEPKTAMRDLQPLESQLNAIIFPLSSLNHGVAPNIFLISDNPPEKRVPSCAMQKVLLS